MKNTKRALLMSVMSMLLCIAMLAGSTFAWFTDSVTSGKNTIVAGNLDIELYYKNVANELNENGKAITQEYKRVEATTNIFEKSALWEPGHVEVVYLKAVNVGTLALKYALGINVADGEHPGKRYTKGENGEPDQDVQFFLSDYIQFVVLDGNTEITTREELIAEHLPNEGKMDDAYKLNGNSLSMAKEKLMPKPAGSTEAPENIKDCYDEVILVVYMPWDVDDRANYRYPDAAKWNTMTEGMNEQDIKELEDSYIPYVDLGVNLVATQTPEEEDSFGDDYDAAAPLATITTSITEAINNGASKANAILAEYKDGEGNPYVYFDKALKTEKDGTQSIQLHFTEAALQSGDTEFLNGVVEAVTDLIVESVKEEAANIKSIEIGAGMNGAVKREIEIDEETEEVVSDWVNNDTWLYQDLYALAEKNNVDDKMMLTVLKIMNRGVDVKITDNKNKSQTYRMSFDIPNFDELIGEGNNG